MKLRIQAFSLKDKTAFKILIVWVFILSILYSTLSIVRHNHYQTGAFDLGIYDQAIWQYSKFIYPFNSIKDRFILGDHFTLTMPLLGVLYWIKEDVRMILVFQAFFLAFSAIGIYKTAINRKLSPFVSLIISFSYSLFYGIQSAVFFDFHPITIAVGLLPWLAYFFETAKWKLFYITLVFFLLTQENAGIALACLGVIYIFYKKYRKAAIAFIIGGLGVSLVEAKLISLMSNVGFEYTPRFPQTAAGYITGFFDDKQKIDNWKFIFLPNGFITLFSPGALLAVTVDLAQYYLTGFDRMWSPYMHHRAILAPLVSLGVLDVFVFLKNRKINVSYLAIFLFITTVFFQYFFHFPINKLVKKEYWYTAQWMKDNDELMYKVPKDASIVTTQSITPHLSHRNQIFLAYPRLNGDKYYLCGEGKKACWWLDHAGKAEYLVVNVSPEQWITQTLESPENFNHAIENMEKDGEIKLVKSVGTARLYRFRN